MQSYKELCDAHDRVLGTARSSILEHLQQKGIFKVVFNGDPIPFDQVSSVRSSGYSTCVSIDVHGIICRRDAFGEDIDDSVFPITINSLCMESSLSMLEQVEKGYYEIHQAV